MIWLGGLPRNSKGKGTPSLGRSEHGFLAILAVLLSLPVTARCQETFLMGLLAPWNASFDSFSALTSASALSIAMETVQADPTLNNNIKLEFMTMDTACTSKKAAGNAVRMHIEYKVDAFIGPPCSVACRPVAELASFWDKPIISWVATDPDFSDPVTYSTLARTLGPFDKMGLFLLQFLALFNWNRVAVISSDFLLWKDASKALRKVFTESNLTISYSASYTNKPTDAFMERTLRKVVIEARIIIIICPTLERRDFVLKAFDLGMTNGEYVFLTMDVTPVEDVTSIANVWRGNDGRDQAARQAFESVFHVTLAALNKVVVKDLRKEVARRMRLPPWKQYISNTIQGSLDWLEDFSDGDKYSAFLHDAVYLYAIAINETLAKGGDPRSGLALAESMKWKRFRGKTGWVILDGNADREPDYWIMDMAANGTFIKLAEIVNQEEEFKVFNYRLARPRWPGGSVGWGKAPPDSPQCGFLGELCDSEELQGWAIALTVLLPMIFTIIGILIAVFTYRKVRFESGLREQLWRVSWEDIEPMKTTKSKDGSTSSINNSSGSGAGGVKISGSLGRQVAGASKDHLQSIPSIGTGTGQLFSEVGLYRGTLVSIKLVKKEHIQLSRNLMMEFNEMKDIAHENLNIFVGACIDPPNLCLIWHYCNKGSLQDVLENDAVKLDTTFKFSFMSDLAKGMLYVHSSHLQSHGNLKSSNCLIDARWTLKITDYGLPTFLASQNSDLTDHEIYRPGVNTDQDVVLYRRKLWTAPEILRENVQNWKGTQKGDIYSFAIICFEISMRSEPFPFDNVTPRDIVNRVRNGESIPYRPALPDSCEMGKPLVQLIRKCWSENVEERPNFQAVRSLLRKMTKGEVNIMDSVLNMMEKYAYNLEEVVEERTQQLVEEKKKTDRLLYRMLPTSVADALKLGQFVQPQTYDQSTIYFSDIVGFTSIASDSSPMQIVDFLNDLYSCFDEIIEKHDVYKVETIGDAYMVVSGVPVSNGLRHSAEIANCSLDLLSSVTHFKIRHRPSTQLALRIGLHTGPCVAGVVGNIMPRYCLFGDAVNMAARMESSGKPLGIHISKLTYIALKEHGIYHMALRGDVNVKGKGLQTTYWLLGKTGFDKPMPKFDRDNHTRKGSQSSGTNTGSELTRGTSTQSPVEGMPKVV